MVVLSGLVTGTLFLVLGDNASAGKLLVSAGASLFIAVGLIWPFAYVVNLLKVPCEMKEKKDEGIASRDAEILALRAEKVALEDRLRPKIGVVFDRDCKGCLAVDHLRLGLVNMGGETIDDVHVFVAEMVAADPVQITDKRELRGVGEARGAGLRMRRSPDHTHIEFLSSDGPGDPTRLEIAERPVLGGRYYSGRITIEGESAPAVVLFQIDRTFGPIKLALKPL